MTGKKSHEIRNITYASVLDYDNNKYIKYLGGKRDTIVSLKAKEPLKAPTKQQAVNTMIRLLDGDQKFRNSFLDPLGRPIGDHDLNEMKRDPMGETAHLYYFSLNSSMTLNPEYHQKAFKEELVRSGYNLLRDEADYYYGRAKAPLIILNPEKTLEVTKSSEITKSIQKKSKQKLKEYKIKGEKWLDDQIYE